MEMRMNYLHGYKMTRNSIFLFFILILGSLIVSTGCLQNQNQSGHSPSYNATSVAIDTALKNESVQMYLQGNNWTIISAAPQISGIFYYDNSADFLTRYPWLVQIDTDSGRVVVYVDLSNKTVSFVGDLPNRNPEFPEG